LLELIDVGTQSIEAYAASAGAEVVEELRALAEPLRGARVLHLNATPYGGGVAEILRSKIPLLRDLGLAADWRIICGDEAFFTVTKDPARPFVVAAGNGEVKVRGTAFDVKLAGDVTVAVVRHTVEVSTATSAPVKVTAGQEVSYGARGVSAVTAADLDAVQAWRQDQIVFRDVPLSAVLAELGRYRRGSVVLLGGSLGKRHVTAVFDARNADAALDTIAQSLSLRMYRATDLLTVIVPNNDPQKNPASD